jgi:hypothetical protein
MRIGENKGSDEERREGLRMKRAKEGIIEE